MITKAAFDRHPRGLATLFMTEMWERFSYYGMRALLVLYLVNGLEHERADALHIYASYTALVYLTPIIGGYLADRWLGARRAVLIGALVMAMGHFAMAFPSLLYLALGLLVAGNGFFKPNISTMVGSLYETNDPRRDGGFTIFYMGINLGAFISPFVCSTLGEKFGWHYGFSAAGIGMLLGLGAFIAGQHRLGRAGLTAAHLRDGHTRLTGADWMLGLSISAIVLVLVYTLVWAWPSVGGWWSTFDPLERIGAAVLGVVVFFALIVLRSEITRIEAHRMLAVAIVGLFWVAFWMGFEQAGGTMNLFAHQLTDRVIFDWEIPAGWFQSVNPLLILVLAPPLSVLWMHLDRSRFALSSVAKQGIGMIILGLGFVVLAIAQQRAELLGQVGPGWLLAVYFLHTTGELFLSPIGLSMVTKLAPLHLVSVVMGLWFTTIAVANYLAGTLEAILQGSGIPLYWFLVGSSMGAGLLLLLLSPLIRRLMHGVS